jgi:transcription initiation factor TFIIIB Brf1 subunit/transcription initiation factor TFIIB
VNSELTILAKFIANKVEKNNIIDDKAPHSIAGGIIFYIAHNCNLPITKTDVKMVSGISEVTINKIFKTLMTLNLIPKVILEKYD